ncbi:SMP-30/gluconolactonase/LRE family protein [Streptomyces sp. SID5785]|uniref:SMP-30/gluconolactonase/LRE family protein n=1 Tax=Streptomyces sp. SID5785 TaxID=2690309 RepID=UPI001361EE6E|nr:SMP-30/gluconolactonase/LRE family protein [Streptomyces sp. SID5785]MZD03520.1 SMP-30/gluconolactonase/LRE family protein [Streptomyces sp. SID5785]
MVTPGSVTALGTERLELGEGPRWTDRGLVLTDILAGRLYGAGPGGPLRELLGLPCPLGAVAPVAGRPGVWIGAAGTGICLLRSGRPPHWLRRPEQDAARPFRMNDGAADPAGRFWAGSMAYDGRPGAGTLARVDHDGTVTTVLDGLSVPNGPAFTADGRTLYLADSARGRILRHPVDPGTGELGEGSVFASVSGGSPDGMAVDRDGGLWSAVWGAGVLHHYRADGELAQVVPVPVRQPAGLCLGGPDGRTLFVTSARVGLADPGPLDGAVLRLRVAVPGAPADSFRPSTLLDF